MISLIWPVPRIERGATSFCIAVQDTDQPSFSLPLDDETLLRTVDLVPLGLRHLTDKAELATAQHRLARTGSARSYSRRFLTDEIVASFARDWRKHGDKSLERLRRTNLAVYVKLAVFLVPKEHKVEHSSVISGLSDDQLEHMIADIQDRIDRKSGKLIDLPNPSSPQPGDPGYKDGIYAHAATAVAPARQRRSRVKP